MRAQHQLLHSRTRVKPRYALLPIEGIPFSRLPAWQNADIRVLAAPALGANFAQYLINVRPQGGASVAPDGLTETFIYCIQGAITLTIDEQPHQLAACGFALIPPTASYRIKSTDPAQLLLLRKKYEPAPNIAPFKPLVGNANEVNADLYCNDPGARLQLLIPDDLQYDLAMNIFTFDPGHCLPYVETHVMEHGLYVLQGKGVYFLDDAWMEVEQTDFIWMGPYVPQSYYATGPTPTKYIYYKNVNREIRL